MFNTKCRNISAELLNEKINNAKIITEDLTGKPIDLSQFTFKLVKLHRCLGIYENNEIKINKNLKLNKLEPTIVHELSHGLQDEENLISNLNAKSNLKSWEKNYIFRQCIAESFAYFNDSWATFTNKSNMNLYEKRAGIITTLFSNISFKEFKKSFHLIKNLDIKINPNNKKVVIDQLNLDRLVKNSNSDKVLGSAIAIISFIANDFSILKTSQALFKDWKNILYNLNTNLNDATIKLHKIQDNLIKIVSAVSKSDKCIISDLIRRKSNKSIISDLIRKEINRL